MAFAVARLPARASKWGVRLRAPPLLWRGWARERVGASLLARVETPQGTIAGAQLGASQLARSGLLLVCVCVCARASTPGGTLLLERTCASLASPSVRAPVRIAGEPTRTHERTCARVVYEARLPAGGARIGARSGSAAAVDGTPSSRVLGWRRSPLETLLGLFVSMPRCGWVPLRL